MWRPSAPSWLGVAVLGAVILGSAPAARAWGILYPSPLLVRPGPPDQSWLLDVPERPGGRSRGKVAVFVFKGDDVYQPMRATVVRLLRRKGFNVTTTLRPVDTAVEYREMSYASNLAVYVEGEVSGEGARQSALLRLYGGVTGHRIASARFSGPTEKIVEELGHTLWTRVGPAITRACASASRPRRREREPLHIEAGTPLEDTPVVGQPDNG
jgi:hypothetical protein